MRAVQAVDALERPIQGEAAIDGETIVSEVRCLAAAQLPGAVLNARHGDSRSCCSIWTTRCTTTRSRTRAPPNEVARADRRRDMAIDALALKAAYVRAAEGFWTRLTAEDLDVELAGVRRELWRRALESVGIEDDPPAAADAAQRYNEYRKKYYAPFPGAMELLRALRGRGKRLGLVTNGFSETHREKDRAAEARRVFRRDLHRRRSRDAQTRSAAVRPRVRAAGRHARGRRDGRRPLRARHSRRGRGRAFYGLAELSRRTAATRCAIPLPDATCASVADVARLSRGAVSATGRSACRHGTFSSRAGV